MLDESVTSPMSLQMRNPPGWKYFDNHLVQLLLNLKFCHSLNKKKDELQKQFYLKCFFKFVKYLRKEREIFLMFIFTCFYLQSDHLTLRWWSRINFLLVNPFANVFTAFCNNFRKVACVQNFSQIRIKPPKYR